METKRESLGISFWTRLKLNLMWLQMMLKGSVSETQNAVFVKNLCNLKMTVGNQLASSKLSTTTTCTLIYHVTVAERPPRDLSFLEPRAFCSPVYHTHGEGFILSLLLLSVKQEKLWISIFIVFVKTDRESKPSLAFLYYVVHSSGH